MTQDDFKALNKGDMVRDESGLLYRVRQSHFICPHDGGRKRCKITDFVHVRDGQELGSARQLKAESIERVKDGAS